jgi:hypothetical protein
MSDKNFGLSKKEIEKLVMLYGFDFDVDGDIVILSNGIKLEKKLFCGNCMQDKKLQVYFCDRHKFSYIKWYVGMAKSFMR